MELSSGARKQLRGMAHPLQAIVRVGKEGVTPGLLGEVNQALLDHELVKVKFLDHKEEKGSLSQEIAQENNAALVGVIGNIAIFYRPHPEKDKRKIPMPKG